MTQNIDYKKIGFKCGLEIHQRLNTHKLFCNCPSLLRDDAPHITVKRHLHAVAGETGEIDIAALKEMDKGLHFIYEGYNDTTCLVEFDEEPPHDMNKDALTTTLQVAKMLHSTVIDEIQVMRKIVINGSNTSGFQRTALVATDGYLDTESGKVGIQTIAVEEESAKDIQKNDNYIIYRLDRLGIPLIEIATDPDIISAEHCKETAAHIGMILRSTGKAARGIGTIRQDINVSIKGGKRIEIKGAQDLKMIPTWVDYEIIRQQNLIKLKEELGTIKVDKTIHNITKILAKSESKVIQTAIKNQGVIKAIKVVGFKGKIGQEVQPGKRLGTEFSDYAKIYAHVGGLFHSDELPKYGITQEDVDVIKKELTCKGNDAFILVADKESKVDKALATVLDRIKMCEEGVIAEVRRANPDGTTSFMRPIPGRARMYPETDICPIKPDIKHIKMPELISEKALRFQKEHGFSKDVSIHIAKELPEFEDLIKTYTNVKPIAIYELFFSVPSQVKKKYGADIDMYQWYDKLLNALDKNKINKSALIDVCKDIATTNKFDIKKYEQLSEKEVEAIIKQVIQENQGAPINALMGKAMGALKGRADGKLVTEIIKKLSD